MESRRVVRRRVPIRVPRRPREMERERAIRVMFRMYALSVGVCLFCGTLVSLWMYYMATHDEYQHLWRHYRIRQVPF